MSPAPALTASLLADLQIKFLGSPVSILALPFGFNDYNEVVTLARREVRKYYGEDLSAWVEVWPEPSDPDRFWAARQRRIDKAIALFLDGKQR